MITPRQLTPLFIAMALGSAPLRAQPAPQTTAVEPATRAPQNTPPAASTQTTPAGTASAAREQTQKSTPADKGKDSPFDYRSSEEISEDVPVSFPVDI